MADQSDAALLRGNANGLQLQVDNPTVAGPELAQLKAALEQAKSDADAAEAADAALVSANTALTNAKTLADVKDATALEEAANESGRFACACRNGPSQACD